MSRENIDMDRKPHNKETSLRNVYAALANVADKLAEDETGMYRAQRRREARKLRELARKEPPPKGKEPPLMTTPRYVYTVRAECGVGEFLWRKSRDESCLVGGNMFSLMEIASDQDLISADLFNAMSAWAREYMAGQPEDWSLPWNIDWPRFNEKGIALARRLKGELGSSADVQYVRPDQDPGLDRLLLVLVDDA